MGRIYQKDFLLFTVSDEKIAKIIREKIFLENVKNPNLEQILASKKEQVKFINALKEKESLVDYKQDLITVIPTTKEYKQFIIIVFDKKVTEEKDMYDIKFDEEKDMFYIEA